MKDFLKNIFLRILGMAIMLIIMSVFFSVIDFFSSDSKPKKVKTNTKTVKKETKPERIISNYINWYDYKNYYYNTNLKISYNDYLKSIRNKENNYASTIESLYSVIYKSDKLDLDLVYKELDFIRRDRSLSKRKFAEIIVSMIQHMPYNIVSQESCFKAQMSDDSLREMILSGIECDGNVYGGVYSPLELVKKMKGDCDSRTLFIYTVLKKFNYDVVILNSEIYAHSIIGLNIPSSGRYKYYNGKRYYTWETTAKGYDLGILPAECSNIKYWYVALT
jgi:hypothetical protein